MYELSPNLKDRIQNLIDNEPVTDDFTTYTVMLNGSETTMPGAEVHALRKKNSEIAKKEIEALKATIGDDPNDRMEASEFEEWYEENVVPKLDDFEMVDHDFDVAAFSDAANIFHKETKDVRAQFKDEIIEFYDLRGSDDADYWIMESGGEGIPTRDVDTVIKAFDSLVRGIDPEANEENQVGTLEA